MRAHLQFAFVLLLVLSGPHLAAAQSVLFVPLQSHADPRSLHLTEVLLTPSGPTSVLRQVTIPGDIYHSPFNSDSLAVSSDGRYVALWLQTEGAQTEGQLVVFDRRTEALHILPGIRGQVVSDPINPRFFVDYLGDLTVIDAQGIRSLPVPGRGFSTHLVISPDGRELFMRRVVHTPEGERVALVAVDAETGLNLRVLVTALGDPGNPRAISADGQTLFITAIDATVKAIDAASGVELASVDLPSRGMFGSSIFDVVFDAVHNRLFVSRRSPGIGLTYGLLHVLDADSLIEIGVGVGTFLNVGVPTLHEDRTTGTVVSVGADVFSFGTGCDATWVHTWGAADAPLSSFAAATGGMCPGPIAVASPPATPTGLTAAVTGPQATLTWSSVPGAGGYLVEAGSGPGANDLAQLTVATQPQLTVNDVPPGTYYVRVRALNEIGRSGPSNEVVVTVP